MYSQSIANDVLDLSSVELGRLNNLTEYNVSIYMITWINELSNYLEFPFRKNDGILGHTLKDDLGITTTINENIEDCNQKIFTQAHELGHLIIHDNILNGKGKIDCEKSIFGKDINTVEQEANWFAANLLLPRRVLYSHIMEEHTVFEIKRCASVSKETILYRINNILKKIFWLDKKECDFIIQQYSSCFHHYEVKNSVLYKFLDSAVSLPHLDSEYILTSKIMNNHQHNEKLLLSLMANPVILESSDNYSSDEDIFNFNLNSAIGMSKH